MPTAAHDPAKPSSQSFLRLPEPPAGTDGPVKAWNEPVEILTYAPAQPDRNPMFLEKRVYQGSSGRVYPLPFIDRIATEPKPKLWQAIHLENDFIRLMILPEIGGRIHVGYDKTTGYDFFYRQNVIKPALVGLAGPWISGGVEFNWPQHHRPATFMPVESEIEHGDDGSVTVWSSDHDPMLRMKGMHGVCLHPNRAVVELKVRLYNRTQYTQTFLWWANVATCVHEKYQSFFPSDVRFVADHAKRAITSFPQSHGIYYGVNYGERAANGVPADEAPRCFVPDGSYPANDLSWYANIPVPTSYMITGTDENFFGGYDHRAGCGVVHVANHHIAPGKKQWTWGNHEFGYAWDRSLTDRDGPYIELMAGVYTDNQPDFSWLAPWETKTFQQCWYPIHGIGVPQAANLDAALSVRVDEQGTHIGLCVTRDVGEITVTLRAGAAEIDRREALVDVANPLVFSVETVESPLRVEVWSRRRLLIHFDAAEIAAAKPPAVAVEPPAPADIAGTEELYLTGLHLQQYRHATRHPEAYWQEAIRRDPEDSRTNNALGLWRLRRGEFDQAAAHFEVAIARLARLNPNPRDGEPYYNLGVTERLRGRDPQAYDAFYKAIWNAAWRGPAYLALAEIDACRADWQAVLDHVRRSLLADAENLNALNLKLLALTRLGRTDEAAALQAEIRALDPLDVASRFRDGIRPASGQQSLDLAFDLLRSGQHAEAAKVLRVADALAQDGSAPTILFTLAIIETQLGLPSADETWARANAAPLDYCFPSRLEEMIVLQAAIAAHPDQPSAFYLLGNWLYDRRRHEEAIDVWEIAAKLNPEFPTVWRNLGIAMFNVRGDAAHAKHAFDRAFELNSADGRVFYERDQLWKRIGVDPSTRINELREHPELTWQRDDLSGELATLCNQLGEPANALHLLEARRFQPWEGGEGLVLAQYVRARLLLGQEALDEGDPTGALVQLQAALRPPENLSEAKHLLANQSDLYYWIGEAYAASGDQVSAAAWWQRATRQRGDFQQMSVRQISMMTYWTAMAHLRLGAEHEAREVFQAIYDHSLALQAIEPKIDYFATSLPAMLLFEDDLCRRNTTEAWFLRAQALYGLGRANEAAALLAEVLQADSNHTGASDLLRLNKQTHAEVKPHAGAR
jgi:tetratricopeptide (TPR) repeat protein